MENGWWTYTVPLLHSLRAVRLLYNNVFAHWGKQSYIQMDNSTEFAGSFLQLCKGLGIVQYHITIDSSKAYRQVDRMIWILKGFIQHGLTKEPTSLWTNHLASILLHLCMTASRMTGITLFLLSMCCLMLLLSLAIPGLPMLPDQSTPDKEEVYLTKVSRIVT